MENTKEKKKIIEIRVVGNGYIIYPERSQGFSASGDDIFIAEDFDKLAEWLHNNLDSPKFSAKHL